MNELPYPSLLDKEASLDNNLKAFKAMPSVVRMFQGQPVPLENRDERVNEAGFDKIFKTITTSMDENNGYYIEGEMINQFIQAFPEMKMAWKNLSTEQKWIFMEGLHYGIRPLINKHYGYTQK